MGTPGAAGRTHFCEARLAPDTCRGSGRCSDRFPLFEANARPSGKEVTRMERLILRCNVGVEAHRFDTVLLA